MFLKKKSIFWSKLERSYFNCFYFWVILLILAISWVILILLPICNFHNHDNFFCDVNLTIPLILLSTVFYALAINTKKEGWIERRRKVDRAEVESLKAEFKSYLNLNNDIPRSKLENAKQEYEIICNSKNNHFLELDLLGLRNSLVDIYPNCELEAKCYTELRNLEKYSNELDDYKKIEKRVEKLIDEAKNPNLKDEQYSSQIDCKIRAEIKEMRSEYAFLDKTWAIGEVITVCHLSTSIGLIVGTFLIGILPIVIPTNCNKYLELINWIFLGSAGGIFTTLLKRHKEDYPDIGETEGKKIWKTTFSSMVVGGITATLFYSALKSGLISGKAFPMIKNGCGETIDWKNTGLTIFWALFSGISTRIYYRLIGIAEEKV